MSVASIKSRINQLEKKKKQFQKRKKSLESVKSSAPKKMSKAADAVNEKISDCAKLAAGAFSGVTSEDGLILSVKSYKQSESGSDEVLGEAIESVRKEISRCEKRIQELDSEISKCEAELKREKEKEKEKR